MGMTAVEKILAKASGLDRVRPGEIVYPQPELVVVHDFIVAPSKRELDALGIDRLHDPERVIVVTDHAVLYTSRREAEIGAVVRRMVKDFGIRQFDDVGRGGHGHVFLAERGIVLPGMFLFDNDRHCTNHGAYGAFAMRTGAEITRVLATGTLWTMVPKTIRMALTGKLQPGVYARDIGLRMATELKPGGAFGVEIDYRVLELTGPALAQFSLDARVALCTAPTEVRAIGVFIPPSAEILAEIERAARRPFTPVYSDPDAEFEARIEFDIGAIGPQVALTGAAETGVDVARVAGIPVDHAFIGSCGAGKWEDLAVAARVLEGQRVAPGVRLFIVPGTEDTSRRMYREGLGDIFNDAGALLLPAGCGPCFMGNMAPVHTGEVSISTAATNPLGRMGGEGCELLVASPATVAASAVAGRVTDPRTVTALAREHSP
ncbi:MAG: aconitase family protein [Desulfobacterales bacterium]|nr:aconitase family protein [Desulfobacterales bacterium]